VHGAGGVCLAVLACGAVGLDHTEHASIGVLHAFKKLELMLHNLHRGQETVRNASMQQQTKRQFQQVSR
jgi:hypothetical protein